ncbi:bifunctional diaminohydroxyphosphoribosylaminopyrimidine deaminase/5-amino-6-(5-phosphoribosylamino)uracil reductase RibD [Corynebacterium anserum]|uniref:Riboflavin biosynthesis protein RibD n=1 Tax=Corynebacterium anserum TaxID=2684406 RepID=A0A7G7YNH1_9CORY|nr:bifunctional diaminohydroxyphosphoribosylaminopyrimidine deaminase/5-amino-6-(5-phosphoribosylamino)uracil reductase RibD [Corynebacterium anserum]QNH96041.1 bifunctional diaminohydroxyphosphoribosylaminopyrimidine deaminase/5-amino-6-(5-phosphoribosylamino)uracil reductase RibD [Corynebacterium anserum]
MADLLMFSEANALGHSVAGSTSPNPPVGCVLYDSTGQRVIGRGATEPAGGAHAEVVAIRDALHNGESTVDARAVVTLEPCNHTGRTGPCSQALIDAGITRVDFLFSDPNPVAVGGADHLREHGIDVHGPYLPLPYCDETRSSFQWLPQFSVEPWLVSTVMKRPHVTLKLASTIDGFVAASDNTSKWITSEQARRVVHEDRRHRDAIIVGTGTVKADNPRLTARGEDGTPYPQQPLRVIMGQRSIPEDSHIYDAPGRALHIRSHDVKEVLADLRSRGIVDVLVEGGPRLTGAFLKAGIADAIQLYQAPAFLLAGYRNVECDANLASTLDDIQRFTPRSVSTLGSDILLSLSH